MIKLTVDDKIVEVEDGSTVFQACEKAGVEVPVFCYHPKLSIAGNCRMCLVEVEKSPKPVASCAMPAAEGMVVKTKTDMVKKAREGVLELLLINHPLDCPICDQGGECDLQDITVSYGCGSSRFDLNKRAVTDKNMGPLIKTIMTRCIHCTRCVRFAHEIAGTDELAAVNRGEHMEITTLLEGAVTSELSGNLVDVCPVGALTNKPYAFHGRPWELTKTPTIDVMDGVGSHIRLDTRGSFEVMRVLPRGCDDINEDWISDRTRFAYDGLKYQRLDKPYIREKGKLTEASWTDALNSVTDLFTSHKPDEIAVLSGPLADVDGLYALKKLMEDHGVEHFECRTQGSKLIPLVREDYLFNTTIAGIEQTDVCLIVGANPRTDATLVNARLRKGYLNHGLRVALVGEQIDLTYPYEYLGDKPVDLEFLRDSKHPVTKALVSAKNPMMIVGEAALIHPDSDKILALIKDFALTHNVIRKDWNGLSILHTQAGTTGALDLGYLPAKSDENLETLYAHVEAGRIKVLYLYGVDDLDFSRLKKALIIYQGHHGDSGAHNAQVILPGAAYSEKTALYVNIEGRVQQAVQAVAPPGEAREDWKIIRALSDVLQKPLPFDNHSDLLSMLMRDFPMFKMRGEGANALYVPKVDARLAKAKLSNRSLINPLNDVYLTNVVTKHSKILAECSRLQREGQKSPSKKARGGGA